MNDKMIQEVDKLIHQLTTNLHAIAAPAWHICLAVIQANALVTFIEGIGGMLALALVGTVLWKFASHGDKHGWDFETVAPLRVLSVVLSIGSAVTFFLVFFNVWNWIAIFN